MTDAYAIQPVSDYKDRTIGLVVFGIAQCLLGILSGLVEILLVVGAAVLASSEAGTANGTDMTAMIPGFVMYAIAAVWFISMGVGSILARRWARALTLVSSWIWLVMGIVGTLAFMFFVPALYDDMGAKGQLPEGAVVLMKVFFMVFMVIVFVLIPGALILFYGSRHVKATCEAKDPKARWTDACPLPVLGLSVWACFIGLSMLSLGIYRWALPFFGFIVTGWAGALFAMAVMVSFLYVAWGAYRLNIKAWWVAMVAVTLLSVSTVVTFYRHNLMDYYQLMGMSPLQLEQVEQMLPQVRKMILFYALFPVIWLGYLLYVRKYFVHAIASPTSGSGGLLSGVDIDNNAALLDRMDEGRKF
ncbi:MAG: hypothetical protein SGI88_09620 [Candidatus Hydrogenedentes bacterium]|nr:hypothetical protein [Candidatus Hydrogenedentota bacterium]